MRAGERGPRYGAARALPSWCKVLRRPVAGGPQCTCARVTIRWRQPMVTLQINGQAHTADVPSDMPLLWVLRDVIGLTGTKFGCGIAQCGACTVHLDGQAVRSCVLPVGSIGNKAITTIEAIGDTTVS